MHRARSLGPPGSRTTSDPVPAFVLSDQLDATFYQALQQRLRAYNRRTALAMEPPEARPLNIRVEDEAGELVGGLAAVTYWGWLVIRLLILDEAQRGKGLGQRLLHLAHQEAQARGCTQVQTLTYDFQALPFYLKQGYRIVGQLDDYPPGHTYYWLRKEFGEEDPGQPTRPAADPGSEAARGARA
jgi:GNAT superfamily N-acetyltransferase